jgi:hypothetical protein
MNINYSSITMNCLPGPNELLMHILNFCDIKTWSKFRLTCKNHNIINGKSLEHKYMEYCMNKYTCAIIMYQPYYVQLYKYNGFTSYCCKQCSFVVMEFTPSSMLRHGINPDNHLSICKQNNKLFFCDYDRPHVDKICGCPLSIKICLNCDQYIYKFQYLRHMADCCKNSKILNM